MLVNGDLLDEANETFFLNLTNAANATIADGQGLGAITDDDGPPSLSVNDVTVTEGDSGTTSATFTVTLAPASGQNVSVDYSTADGTATAPADYAATSGTLTFAPGQTTRPVSVQVAGDTVDEINETFTVNLSNAVNAAIADGTGLGTILDDDSLPALSINDVTVTESDAGTTSATFTVGLNAPSSHAISVDYGTADGTATAPADYAAGSGSLTFAAGQTSKQVTVLVNGDLLDEANETYFVNLSNPTNATIDDGQGLGTITDNDPLPSLSINDATVVEGNTGTVSATYTVTLNTVSGRSVTVDYATANGSAVAPADYQAANGTLTFTPGQTTRQLTVLVNGDLLDEINETYLVNLSNPANATISDSQGAGTITDDDALPALSVNDVAVIEGDTGNENARFTVTLDAASGRNVSVDFATADGTAQAPGDYQARTGTLTFAPGETSKMVNVQVKGDVIDESNETYFLNLSNSTNATISDGQGIGTILDDDGLPSLSISDVTTGEGQSGHDSRELHGQPELTQRADGQCRLGDGGRKRACSRRLRRHRRERRLQSRSDDEDRHGPGARRPARRDQRELLRQPVRTGQRDDRRRAGRGHDHGRRCAACSVGQRRHRHRGQHRDRECELHRQPERAERTGGDGRLRHCQRHRSGARRLPGRERDGHLRGRPDLEAGDGARERRHARRGERDLLRQPHEPDERDDLRRAGRGHDHGRRPDAGAVGRQRHGRRG